MTGRPTNRQTDSLAHGKVTLQITLCFDRSDGGADEVHRTGALQRSHTARHDSNIHQQRSKGKDIVTFTFKLRQ